MKSFSKLKKKIQPLVAKVLIILPVVVRESAPMTTPPSNSTAIIDVLKKKNKKLDGNFNFQFIDGHSRINLV
jgi:hypothetical protein